MRVEQNNLGVNQVQQFSAINAFKEAKNPKAQDIEQADITQSKEGINTTSAPTLMDKIDVNEVRECAKTVGEYNITDEDIKYGLIYGRSVIAEWLC